MIRQMETMDWWRFLQQCPPGGEVEVTGSLTGGAFLSKPVIELYCNFEACDRVQLFESITDTVQHRVPAFYALVYRCRNCHTTTKAFSVYMREEKAKSIAFKLGEMPPFGPPIPARVITMIGGDREMFLRGRRAETQGLGIGAYAYYRRVIESQKNRLLDQIIKVTRQTSGDQSIIAELERAKEEAQFTKAIEQVKQGIPEALKINGQNPLSLLHAALSDGIHALSDEQCLQRASDIRVVLTELANRMDQLLADHTELAQAVSRLANRNAPPATPKES